MKKFLRFLASIIVICVIGATLYILLKNTSIYESNKSGEQLNQKENYNQSSELENNNVESTNKESISSGEQIRQEKNNEDNVDVENNQSENIAVELEEDISGDLNINDNIDITSKIEVIKNIESQNNSAIARKTLEENLGLDIIGSKNQSFFTSFQLTEVPTTIQVAGTMVYVIPSSDFISAAQYHYDENGNLVLYISELTGVGGQIRYYFENDVCILQENKVEDNAVNTYEDITEIIQRANSIKEKYMK